MMVLHASRPRQIHVKSEIPNWLTQGIVPSSLLAFACGSGRGLRCSPRGSAPVATPGMNVAAQHLNVLEFIRLLRESTLASTFLSVQLSLKLQ